MVNSKSNINLPCKLMFNAYPAATHGGGGAQGLLGGSTGGDHPYTDEDEASGNHALQGDGAHAPNECKDCGHHGLHIVVRGNHGGGKAALCIVENEVAYKGTDTYHVTKAEPLCLCHYAPLYRGEVA